MRYFLAFTVAFFGLLALAQRGASQSITLSEDPNAWSCYIPTSTPSTFYVLARLGGSVSGITGAEFTVSGVPDQYIAISSANPSVINIGDPFAGGCNMAFPSCQPGGSSSNNLVLLYTVSLIQVAGEPQSLVLQVEAHSSPSNMNFDCPLVTLCDEPTFTKVCVQAGAASSGPIIPVPSQPFPPDEEVDVPLNVSLTWGVTGPFSCCGLGTGSTGVYFGTSAVKSLYR